MPTILMILKVKSVSDAWDIHAYLKQFHNLLRSDRKQGGDLGIDLTDKGIYSLEMQNGQYHLICLRSYNKPELNVLK